MKIIISNNSNAWKKRIEEAMHRSEKNKRRPRRKKTWGKKEKRPERENKPWAD